MRAPARACAWVALLSLSACERMPARGNGGPVGPRAIAERVPDAGRPDAAALIDPGPATVAEGQSFPFMVALDERNVYWNTGDAHLRRAAKAGGPPQDLSAEFTITIVPIGDFVVYTTQRAIKRVARDGSRAPETLVTLPEDPLDLVTDGSHLYFTMFDGSMVGRIPLAGGPAEKLLAGERHPTIAVDATDLYVSRSRGGTIRRLPKAGGTPTTLIKGLRRPLGLALHGDDLFWASEKDGTIVRMPKQGGTPIELASGQVNQESMAFSATHVYWATWGGTAGSHALMAVPLTGGTPIAVALNLDSPSGLASDGVSVYIANKGKGRIEKFPLLR